MFAGSWLLLVFAVVFVSAWRDPSFSIPTSTMAAAVTCPRGIQGKAGGIVFLVHGTGSIGSETWSHGPYNLILPDIGPGYDICWIDLPGRALGNAATSSEYVAYNIVRLAELSSTGEVFVIGHSQGGGLNIPWALDFFASTRTRISGFVSLSGDVHGSLIANPACLTMRVVEGGCAKSLFQQDWNSAFIRAQEIDGNKALVPMTSIFSLEDEIIPFSPISSRFKGASNILIQGLQACGPQHVVDHFLAPFDNGYFGIVLDALANGGVANTDRFDKSYCSGFKGNTLVDPENAAAFLKMVTVSLISMLSSSSPYASTEEPPLPEYVCGRYPDAGFTCARRPLV